MVSGVASRKDAQTHLFVMRLHGSPSPGSFGAHSSLCNVCAEVCSDDRARRLHVEEERCERPLGRIGIVLSLLALLLVAGRSIASSCRRLGWAGGAIQFPKLEQRVLAQLGQRRLDVEPRTVLAEDGIGMFDVGGREGLDGVLQRGKSGDDLCPD